MIKELLRVAIMCPEHNFSHSKGSDKIKKDIICLLVGPSGSGKTTIANKLSEEKGWKVLQSYTTRPKRYSNETGHIFVSEEEFEQYKNDLCAYTEFDGYKYWATNQQVDESEIYIIDPAGVDFLFFKNKIMKKTVFI